MKKPTPLENAAGIIINSPQDIIMGWEATSLLIYCYKNDKDLIEWLSLLSDDLIEECVDKRFHELSDHLRQDFLQVGLYLNLMKCGKWFKAIHEDKIILTADRILFVGISMESINRTIIKEWGKDALPGTGKLINMTLNKPNKYDLGSYLWQANQGVEIEYSNES